MPDPLEEPNRGYEFSPAEESLVASLADRVRGTASLALLAAILFLSGAAYLLWVGQLPVALLALTVAGYLLWAWDRTKRAAEQFQAIVETEGLDIEHLMTALDSMLSLYRAKFYLALTAFALLLVLAFPPAAR